MAGAGAILTMVMATVTVTAHGVITILGIMEEVTIIHGTAEVITALGMVVAITVITDLTEVQEEFMAGQILDTILR